MSKVKRENKEKKTSKQMTTDNIPPYYLETESSDSSPNHRFCDGDCGGCPSFYHCNK